MPCLSDVRGGRKEGKARLAFSLPKSSSGSISLVVAGVLTLAGVQHFQNLVEILVGNRRLVLVRGLLVLRLRGGSAGPVDVHLLRSVGSLAAGGHRMNGVALGEGLVRFVLVLEARGDDSDLKR